MRRTDKEISDALEYAETKLAATVHCSVICDALKELIVVRHWWEESQKMAGADVLNQTKKERV